MKIRITEPGWAGYTGMFGSVSFEDGISVEEVSTADARQLGALIALENVDPAGPSASIASVITEQNTAAAAPATLPTAGSAPASGVTDDLRTYTAAELGEIADTAGMKGIREIAEPRGLRDNSTKDLISKILADQDTRASKAAASKSE